MSTKKKGEKLLAIFLILIVVGLLVSFSKQILLQKRLGQKINLRTKELQELETKNQELRAKLKEVESPEFLEKEVKKMLGIESEEQNLASVQPGKELRLKFKTFEGLPKYKKWLNLFVY